MNKTEIAEILEVLSGSFMERREFLIRLSDRGMGIKESHDRLLLREDVLYDLSESFNSAAKALMEGRKE